MSFKKGISLISLVVTIIVLLILTAIVVTISVDGNLLGLVKDTKSDSVVAQINDYAKETKSVIIFSNKANEDNVVDMFIDKVEEDNLKKDLKDQYEIVSSDKINKTVILKKDDIEVMIYLEDILTNIGDPSDISKKPIDSRYTITFKYKKDHTEIQKKMVVRRNQTLQQYLDESGDIIPQGVTEWVPAIQYNTPIIANIEYKEYIEKVEIVVAHFNLAGGTLNGESTVESREYFSGDIIGNIGTPVKAFHLFTGWSPSLNDPIIDATTYVAQWAVIQYTFTFKGNGGYFNHPAITEKAMMGAYGAPVVSPGTPTRDNHNFIGWSPSLPSTYDGNKVFTAQWEIKKYTITYNLAGGSIGGSTANQTRQVEHNTMPPELAPTRTDYVLIGWTPEFVVATKNQTYTAIWSRPMEIQMKKDSVGEQVLIPITFNTGQFALISNNGGAYVKYTANRPFITNSVAINTPFTVKIAGRIKEFAYTTYIDEAKQFFKLEDWGELGAETYTLSSRSSGGVRYGLPNLTGTIPAPTSNSFINVGQNGLTSLFYQGKGLTGSIPPNLFANSPNARNFDSIFYGCNGLTGNIPADLFANSSNVTNFKSAFQSCSGLTGNIPASLFANCTNATTFTSVFYFCTNLTGSIPSGLFANCSKVTSFDSIFNICTNLTGNIPASLFANSPNATTFNAAFSGCTNLTGNIPANLFANSPNATIFTSTFGGCAGLTGNIPANLFANSPNATHFRYTFHNCENLTGSIPVALFDNCTKVKEFYYTFGNCTGLTGIPAGLFDNCLDVITFEWLFSGCTNLTGNIPSGLFANCTKATTFNSIFADCRNLTGSIPADLFANCTSALTFSSTFSNCESLTGGIPAGLFANCTEVTSFIRTFFHCSGLTGIPIGLFDNCPNVTSFSQTFAYCYNLTGSIPPELFDNCPNATSFPSTFISCENLTGDAIPLWDRVGASGSACYRLCKSLTGYYDNAIPADWK